MLSNAFVFSISTMLGASCFIVPQIVDASQRLHRVLVVLALYCTAFLAFLSFYDLRTALAVVMLGAGFAIVAEALVIHYQMVHSPHDQKHRRCY
jgi:hypothetical protein